MKNRDNQKLTGKEKHDRISILKNQIKQLKINNKPKDDIKLEKLEIELYNLENINNIKDISINSQKSYKENIKKPLVIQNNNKQINKFDSKVIENQKIQINDLKKQNDSFNSKIKNLTKSNDLLKRQFDTSNSKIKELTKNNEILKKENANLIKSNLIKFKALENQKNQIINNLKKQNDTSNSKLKELTKNNEALKKENANSIKSKTLENQKKEIKELTKQITELNISNNEQKATIKKLSKINSKTINSLEKNFKFLLY
jgi:chromosome segregation ATPase